MSLISSSLAITVWILNLYYHSDDRPIPKWAKHIMKWISAALCLKCGHSKSVVSPETPGMLNERVTTGGTVSSIGVNGEVSIPETSAHEIILPEYVREYVLRRAGKETSDATANQNKGDWEALARMMDRLFVIIFLVVTMIATVRVYTEYKDKLWLGHEDGNCRNNDNGIVVCQWRRLQNFDLPLHRWLSTILQ